MSETIKLNGVCSGVEVEVDVAELERAGFVRKEPKYWEPKEGVNYAYVGSEGDVLFVHTGAISALNFHNCFEKKEQARKAAEYMRRNNAIVRACMLVDPDFVPDWGEPGEKWVVEYNFNRERWDVDCWDNINCSACCVSTPEKAKEVCNLLTEWGVK